MSDNLQCLRQEIEKARERLNRAIVEKGSLAAAYEESVELDQLLEQYMEQEQAIKEQK